jgi:CP family cyanate transporter-like MFS transporter
VYYALITWWPSVEQAHGVSAADSGWHLFALQMAGLVANLATGWVLHRRADRRMIAISGTGLVLISVSGQLLLPGASLLWMLLAGAGGGSTIVLALSSFGLRNRNPSQAAALSGMAQSIGYALAATGPVLIGLLHDTTGAWTWPFIVLLCILAIQAGAGFLRAATATSTTLTARRGGDRTSSSSSALRVSVGRLQGGGHCLRQVA